MGKYLNISADMVSAAGSVATGIANTIAGINDANKRRQTETALAYLSNQQKDELNQKLLAAKTQTDRLQILSSAIVQYAIANEAGASKGKTAMYMIAAGLGVALLVMAIFLMKDKS